MEEGAQAWGHFQLPQDIWVAGHRLTEADAAKVLQAGGRVTGTDHLHAAFGCCGAHHGVELLVLQLRSSNAYRRQQKQFRRRAEISSTHLLTHFTYTVAILVEGQGAVPGVQMYSNNGALTKLGGEPHFVTFVLQITCSEDDRMSLLKLFLARENFSNRRVSPTCVGESPAGFVVAQQAAEVVLELLQVYL